MWVEGIKQVTNNKSDNPEEFSLVEQSIVLFLQSLSPQ